MSENGNGKVNFNKLRNNGANHPIEEVGQKLRTMMPWVSKNRLVDKKNN